MPTLLLGDNRVLLRTLEADSIDAVVTDPPYGLGKEPDMVEVLRHWLAGDDYTATGGGFMGRTWDSFVPGPATWREVYRVLRPGGHVLMFSGTRTWDLATLALRLAGFEIRDGLMWLYGSGFPKSLDVSKAIDKAAGAERQVVGERTYPERNGRPVRSHGSDLGRMNDDAWDPGDHVRVDTLPATDEAQRWEGWGTALKPAWEPIVLARKPLVGTIAANVLAHGTGAMNIDASRIGSEERPVMVRTSTVVAASSMENPSTGATSSGQTTSKGRFPANVLLAHHEDCVQVGERDVERRLIGADYKQTQNNAYVGRTAGNNSLQGGSIGSTTETVEVWDCVDGCPIKILDRSSGYLKSGQPTTRGESGSDRSGNTSSAFGAESRPAGSQMIGYGDGGGASRFFYCAKTARSERNAGMPAGEVNDHPTVKPVDLMRYLVTLISPPGGVVLDPFMGSGSTGIAAVEAGFEFVGMDDDAHSVEIATHRINHACGRRAERLF